MAPRDTRAELGRLERDVNRALTEIVERVRIQCIEARRQDTVGQLPFFLARRVHEQVAASLALIRGELNGAVPSNVRATLDACFVLGALGSERATDIAEAYVAYELCVLRSMHRMVLPNTTESRSLLPRWEATIPGFSAASSAAEARSSVANIDEALADLGLSAWSDTYEELYNKRQDHVPHFTGMIGFSLFDLAELAGLADHFKSIYWQLSESVHARNVIRDALRFDGAGSVAVAGPKRPELLALALNTVIPTAKIAVTTIGRVQGMSPIAASLLDIWQQRVEHIERDLPER
jgi:hypothetical protein